MSRRPRVPFLGSKVRSPQEPYMNKLSADVGKKARRSCLLPETDVSPLHLPVLKGGDMTSARVQAAEIAGLEADKMCRHEAIVEAFLLNTATMPVDAAIERAFRGGMKLEKMIYWTDIPSQHCFCSTKEKLVVEHNMGLIGHTFFTRDILRSQRAGSHHAWNEEHDGKIIKEDSIVIIFPLWDWTNNLCAIVELTRAAGSDPFGPLEEDFGRYFAAKYKLYSQWLCVPKFPHMDCVELIHNMELEQYLLVFQKKMIDMFGCNRAEMWRYEVDTKRLVRYDQQVTDVKITAAGIVGEAILNNYPINCRVNKMQSSYLKYVDSDETEPVIVVPVIDAKMHVKFAIALRGRRTLPMYTVDDELLVRAISPYMITALDNAVRFSPAENEKSSAEREEGTIAAMLQTTEMLERSEPIDDVVAELMRLACDISGADRGLLYVHNKESGMLETRVAIRANMELSTPVTIDRGIVGKTYTEKIAINVPDAYDVEEFDSELDILTNYRARSLLSIPSIDNRGKVLCVGQFINKRDGKPFSKQDLHCLKILLSMSGMLIENSVFHEEYSEMSMHFDTLTTSVQAMANKTATESIVKVIIGQLKTSVSAECSSVFLIDDVLNALSTYASDGGDLPPTLPLLHGIAALSAKKNEGYIVNDVYHDPRFNKMLDYKTGFKTMSVMTLPLVLSTGVVFGVVEVINKINGIFSDNDHKLFEAFASLLGVILESHKLKEICEQGNLSVTINKWFGRSEREVVGIPNRLLVDSEKKLEILSPRFAAMEWNGIGLFKVAFYLFDELGLLKHFNISAELLFSFLYKLREAYREISYHNWIHAIDVLQFFVYQITTCGFKDLLTPLELLAICVASIAHDVGHQGLDNTFNSKARTPIGILFQDSCLEVHHCTELIRVFSDEQTNLFKGIEDADLRNLWSWIIRMILATDQGMHFKILKQVNDLLDQGPIRLENSTHRILAMTLLMKAANLANVTRPFDTADAWCTSLYDEFMAQGDLETSKGFDLSSPMNSRDKPRKAHGQVTFYTDVCVPLFHTICRIFPELESSTSAAVAENLEKWKLLASTEAA